MHNNSSQLVIPNNIKHLFDEAIYGKRRIIGWLPPNIIIIIQSRQATPYDTKLTLHLINVIFKISR